MQGKERGVENGVESFSFEIIERNSVKWRLPNTRGQLRICPTHEKKKQTFTSFLDRRRQTDNNGAWKMAMDTT